jgi:hypothetical protein
MSSTFQKILTFSLIITLLLIAGCDTAEPKNNAPEINSVTVNPPSVNVNGTATVTVDADDADNDPLTYTYMPSGGSIVGNTASVIWTAPSTAGAVSVTVTVKDGEGGEDTGSGNLMVTASAVVTQVTGTASFPAGVNSDLNNSMVALYTSIANWNAYSPIKWVAISGSGANVSYTIPNVNPGNYYLDVWKDIDNDGAWSAGDFVGWYGSGALNAPNLTEFQVTEGETKVINVGMFIF